MVKKVEQLNPELERPCSEISLSLYDGDSKTNSSESSLNKDQWFNAKKKKQSRFNVDNKGKALDQARMENSEDLRSEAPIIFGDFTNWKG